METTTVLLADDEITVLQGLKRLYPWEANGYAIVGEAMDGMTCLNMALSLKPHLVLMDINMPLMSGLDVGERIREALPDTLVIMVSGYSDAHYMRQAIRNHVFDYIFKPVGVEELADTLGRARARLMGGARQEEAQVGTTIQQMVAYLGDHLSQEVSLQVLADAFHMNATYISQYFKLRTGMNYSAYLSMLRVNRAKALLLNTDCNVGEVAQQVGFHDYRVFSRAFKQATGQTPSQFRQEKTMP